MRHFIITTQTPTIEHGNVLTGLTVSADVFPNKSDLDKAVKDGIFKENNNVQFTGSPIILFIMELSKDEYEAFDK